MYSYVICVAVSLGSCPQPSLPLLSGVAGPSCGSLGWRCGHWPKVAESPGSAQLDGVKGHSLGSHQEQVLFGSRAAPLVVQRWPVLLGINGNARHFLEGTQMVEC